MSRRTRTATTMLVLVGLVAAAAYFGWLGLTRGWFDADGSASQDVPASTCSMPPPVTVRSSLVRVSVYNAGAPAGEATEVMEALLQQGFREGALSDAPEPIEVDGIVVWPGDAGPAAVRLVRRQFDDVAVSERRRSLGPGVDVLVGEDFDRLAPRAPRSIDFARPQRCAPVG